LFGLPVANAPSRSDPQAFCSGTDIDKKIPLNSAHDLELLGTHVSTEFDPQSIIKKLKAGISSAVKAVLIERNYIDKD